MGLPKGAVLLKICEGIVHIVSITRRHPNRVPLSPLGTSVLAEYGYKCSGGIELVDTFNAHAIQITSNLG